MHEHEWHGHDRTGHRLGHVFLGGSHDAHERRTRRVVALTALMMVGAVVAGWLFGSRRRCHGRHAHVTVEAHRGPGRARAEAC
jgi:hypothetical protein